MAVTAIRPYVGVPLDVQANFHGNVLIFVTWEKHLLYAAPIAFPLPPAMKFGDFLVQVLAGVIREHPDAAKIDWARAVWRKEGEPWAPDLSRSIAENGLAHKDSLLLHTPGLDGVQGMGV